jgi:hypothetical protein
MASDLNNARLSTDGGIKYTIVEGFPKGGVSVNGASKIQEQYRIFASDLEAFVAEVVPPIDIIDGNIIIPPLRGLPGAPQFQPVNVAFEPFNVTLPSDPFGQDEGAPPGTYEDTLRVTIDYETNVNSNEDEDRDDAEPETFLERSIRSSMEVLSIPASGVVAAPVNTAEEGTPDYYTQQRQNAEAVKSPQADIRFLVPINEFVFKWRRVIRPHFPNIFATMGCVNGAAYTWLLNAPAGTVLFMGMSGSQEFQNFGTRTVVKPWQLELRFAHKQINQDGKVFSWNHAFDPSPGVGKFVSIFRKGVNGNGSVLHPAANFNAMFAAGPVI